MIPDSHPRARSLRTRELMAAAVAKGLVHPTGLIAHGRGEAFDYLLGEETPAVAREMTAFCARVIREAKHPVLSLNGNVVALAAPQIAALMRAYPKLLAEVNLFHRTPERVTALVGAMQDVGVAALGQAAEARIPGLESDRGLCCANGIFAADVVIVPLEDGDRAQALVDMGKTVIAIDLNPLSRTARTTTYCIVDELTRALDNLAIDLAADVDSLPERPPRQYFESIAEVMNQKLHSQV